jgi:hypothetical protein
MKTIVKTLLVLMLSTLVFTGCFGGEEPEIEKKVTVYKDTAVRGQINEKKDVNYVASMRGSLGGGYAYELQPQPIVPDWKSVINRKAGNYPGPEYPYLPYKGLRVDSGYAGR